MSNVTSQSVPRALKSLRNACVPLSSAQYQKCRVFPSKDRITFIIYEMKSLCFSQFLLELSFSGKQTGSEQIKSEAMSSPGECAAGGVAMARCSAKPSLLKVVGDLGGHHQGILIGFQSMIS